MTLMLLVAPALTMPMPMPALFHVAIRRRNALIDNIPHSYAVAKLHNLALDMIAISCLASRAASLNGHSTTDV